MGRPKDNFWWDLAKKDGGSLQCIYCGKEFKGGVSRIKLHLSGRGGNIGRCNNVPPDIQKKAEEELQGGTSVGEGNRDKALKPSPMKRARYTSVGEDGHGVNVAETGEMSSLAAMPVPSRHQVLSSSSFYGSPSNVVELVKFLMSRNRPVDVFKDSQFWSLLTSVAHPGIQSWLQVLGNSAIIQKSLSNFEYEMNQYMEGVKKSWKTTGCTLILYDLSEGKGKFSADDRYNLVAGFYCPKGFIFVEVDLPVKWPMCCYACELDNVLKNHHLNLSTDDVLQIIDHNNLYKYECQYQEYGLQLGGWHHSSCSRKIARCFRDCVKDMWKYMYEGSDCLRKLIKKADKVYQLILDLMQYDAKLSRTLKLNLVKQAAEGNFATSLSLFRSIMDLRGELMRFLETDNRPAVHMYALCIHEITKDEEFWRDVEDVVKALTPILQLVDLMDTLLPTGAYLQEALDKAHDVLRRSLNRELKPEKFVGICTTFRYLRETDDFYGISRCLNPLYCMNEARWEYYIFDRKDIVRMLERLVNEEERERLEDEASRYIDKCSNPFANISRSECNIYHPVKLWDKYGSTFPVLRKCATKILSRPFTCLCKQVEKCMSRLRGSDNLILRLNAMMKEEFDKLGNETYQPADVDSIFKKHKEQIIA